MEKSLDNWCIKAIATELKPVIKFVNMLQRHHHGILAYVYHPIHTSKLKGNNNQIKELKKRAYGYHDPQYYKLKIKQAFPGKWPTVIEKNHFCNTFILHKYTY